MKRAGDLKRGTRYTNPLQGLIIGGLECLVWGLGAPACLLLAVAALRNGLAWHVSLVFVVSAIVLCLITAITAGEIARQMYHVTSEAYQEIVGEVVKENVDQIPKGRVLLRGATEPAAPQETLLRAAQEGEEVKAEELLRGHLP